MRLHWKELCVAFVMSCLLWYGVSGSEKVETQLEVRVDYRGLPQGLVVTNGLASKATVRIRASVGMLRSLADRDFAFFIDLSDVHKGENIIPINPSYLPFRAGVQVIDITPSRLYLTADTIEQKNVPVVASITGKLPAAYSADVAFMPEHTTISGPSALLAGINSITIPVAVDEHTEPGSTALKRLIPLPEGVDAAPQTVTGTLRVEMKRKEVTVTRAVQVHTSPAFSKFARPEKVSITLEIPEALAAKAANNTEIIASVALEKEGLGTHTVPVSVDLPEGARLLSVDPPEISVTIEQKQQRRK